MASEPPVIFKKKFQKEPRRVVSKPPRYNNSGGANHDLQWGCGYDCLRFVFSGLLVSFKSI